MSPPFEGGAAAPAKRERDSAKHQEKALPGWLRTLESTTPSARLRWLRTIFLISRPSPPSKGGDFAPLDYSKIIWGSTIFNFSGFLKAVSVLYWAALCVLIRKLDCCCWL